MVSTKGLPVIGAHRHLAPSRVPSATRRPLTAQEWEQTNRLGLLLVHALVGLIAGLLMLFNGTNATFDRYGEWVRPTTGALAFVGGALLAAGLARRSVSVRLEVVGLALLSLWALVMTAGFAGAVARAGDPVIAWPWEALGTVPPERLYPIAIYGGLALMTVLHFCTALRLGHLAQDTRHRTAVPLRPARPATGQQRATATGPAPTSKVKHPSSSGRRTGVPASPAVPRSTHR